VLQLSPKTLFNSSEVGVVHNPYFKFSPNNRFTASDEHNPLNRVWKQGLELKLKISAAVKILSYSYGLIYLNRKKIASVGAASKVFVVVTKSTGTAPTATASGKLAARTVTQIKLLVCLNSCISLGVFLYEI
jgi:hypothetical protein